MLFVAFFIGQYWFIFSLTVHELEFNEVNMDNISNDIHQFDSFVSHEDNWSLKNISGVRRVIITTYFSITSMSTIGLGDFYPVSNWERILGSFLLLFGVMLFSLFMGLLLEMINKINNLDEEINHEEELEKFFLLLRG